MFILQPIVVVALLVVSAILVGQRLLVLAGPTEPPAGATPDGSAALRIGLAAALGLGSWAVALFLLGVAHMLRPGASVVIGAVFCFLGWGTRPGLGSQSIRLLRSARPRRRGERALMGMALVITLAALVSALSPPRDPDGLAYHLPLASRFADRGGLEHVSALHSYTAAYPLGVEVVFAALLQLGGESAPACLELACGLLVVVLVAGQAARLGGRRSAFVAAAAVMASPIFIVLLSRTYVDLYFVLVVLGSLSLLVDAPMAAGLLAGVAFGLKPGFGVLPVVAGVTIVVGRAWRRRTLGPLALFLLPAAAVGSCWPLWRWWETGNPAYPLIWGGHDIAPDALVRVLELMSLARYDVFDLLTGRIQVRDALDLALSSGPILLALAPLVLLSPRFWRRDPAAVIGAALALVMVALLYARDRFLLLPLVILAPLSGVLWSEMVAAGGALRRAAVVLLAVGVAWAVCYSVKLEASNVAYVTGRETRADYLRRWFRDFELADVTNRAVESGDGVLRLCRLDCRRYYERYRVVTLESLVLEQGRIAKTCDQVVDLMRTRQLSHVIDCGNLSRLFVDAAQYDAFRGRVDVVYDDGRRKRLLRLR